MLSDVVSIITMCIKVWIEQGWVIHMLKPIGVIRLLKIKDPQIPRGLKGECNMWKRVLIIISEWVHVHVC
jgi:hypothetical protein